MLIGLHCTELWLQTLARKTASLASAMIARPGGTQIAKLLLPELQCIDELAPQRGPVVGDLRGLASDGGCGSGSIAGDSGADLFPPHY